MFDITDEAYLAKRAVEAFDTIVSYSPSGARAFTLSRNDGAELTYTFTDERMSDAYTIEVAAEDKIPDGIAGTPKTIKYCQVLDPEAIEQQVYLGVIVPWAKKEPLKK